MRGISFLNTALAASLFLSKVQAKAVFAHYMVGTVTEDHAHQDIEDAIAMGLDGFALNIGDPTQPFVTQALGYLFGYAAYRNFKLFVSMDLSASGNACAAGRSSCNGTNDYNTILTDYLGSTAWYLGPNGNPLISTFSSGGKLQSDFLAWKQKFANKMYFIPDFDETQGYYDAATGWYDYWGSVVDGLFSWESAWPSINGGLGEAKAGDITLDVTVANGAKAHSKGYMMPLSLLQYKDAYGTNIYRAGNLNLLDRMKNLFSMTNQPDFVEIITWNDGPESHYIGNLWPESNSDPAPAKYSTQSVFNHSAIQPLLTSFITAYKAGGSVTNMSPPSGIAAVGALWFNTILTSATCSENKPTAFDTATNAMNWAVVLPSDAKNMEAQLISGCKTIGTVPLNPGLNYGATTTVNAGKQRLVLVDTTTQKTVLAATSGDRGVDAGCPDGIYNLNPQVVGLVTDNVATGC